MYIYIYIIYIYICIQMYIYIYAYIYESRLCRCVKPQYQNFRVCLIRDFNSPIELTRACEPFCCVMILSPGS